MKSGGCVCSSGDDLIWELGWETLSKRLSMSDAKCDFLVGAHNAEKIIGFMKNSNY